MRWTATDETGWIADLHSAAATVWASCDTEQPEEHERGWLMADLGVLLEVTAGRLKVILEERRWLREQARR
jgi:hypothetical protein